MIKRNKTGHIIIPIKTLIQPHEFNVATILSWTGEDVEFLPVSHVRTPDIKFRGLLWEIKSPSGSSSRTIENNMRAALKQSTNIIIDLSRMRLPEYKCLREIKRQSSMIKYRHRVIVVTKKHKTVEL